MFFCAYRPSGEALTRAGLFGAIARMRAAHDGELDYLLAGPFAAVAARSPLRPRIARLGTRAAIGDVRLTNRADLVSSLRRRPPAGASDLDVVLALLDEGGEDAIARVVGDYGFVVWDPHAQKVLAVRDAFGVKPLYMRRADDVVMFASAVAPLQSAERIDPDFVASYLVGAAGQDERTIWTDVRAIPAAHYARQQGTVCGMRRHWDAAAIVPVERADADAVECFAELFDDAVRACVEPGATWAQLSGGLDSSSVVTTAHALFGPDALGGSVTVVDSMGDGDERHYSNAVAEQCGVRNELVRDYWAWQDDGRAPPATDEPRALYPFYARDRRLYNVAREAGARVVLSGLGADHYLAPSLDYTTDLLAHGKPQLAARELAGWAVSMRQSFWTLARRHLVNPFLPGSSGHGDVRLRPPSWIRADYAERFQLAQRSPFSAAHLGRPGRRVHTQTLANLRALPGWIERWPWGTDAELRYPFLHRPLVEAALAMPVRMRIRPGVQKWVLRQAVGDRLPPVVRNRTTKGGIDSRILWSLQHEQACIDALLRDSALDALGAVDAAALRTDVDRARRGIVRNNVYLLSALGFESWMSVRAGRPLAARPAARTAA